MTSKNKTPSKKNVGKLKHKLKKETIRDLDVKVRCSEVKGGYVESARCGGEGVTASCNHHC